MPRMVAPEISHVQAFLLFQLARGEKKGKALREALAKEGIRQKVPTFFACVRRLIRDDLISAKAVAPSGKARGPETAYSLTVRGRTAVKQLRDFYRRLDRQARG